MPGEREVDDEKAIRAPGFAVDQDEDSTVNGFIIGDRAVKGDDDAGRG